MPELVAVDTSDPTQFVDHMLEIWHAGNAVLPIDHRLPRPAVERLLATLRPSRLVDAAGDVHRLSTGVPVLPGDALVVPTSGSTGEPKGVIHTHQSIAASARATNAGIGTDPVSDRWLCCLPLSHVAGLSVVTRALLSGTPLQVLPGFDPGAVEYAARNGATLTTAVPTALARIDASLFRRIVVGGSFPPSQLPGNCLVSYGLTETGSAVAYNGRALDNVELRIVGGQIQVRGPMLLRAYRSHEPEGRQALDEHGWFGTGDAGSWDDAGRLVVHGRIGDMINTGGEKVWPVEVERCLLRHPRIAEAAVIGRPDPEWGQTVVAIIVPCDPDDPPSLGEVRDHVKRELPTYAAPKVLEVVNELPRTLLGKIERKRLTACRS
ncbi:MAG: long-chain fatty acid--CoA ligase [Acidimicrobiales bacterium]|nr:long-chain fatty acid--CoA ligase [Acidimicrobiales bacterium]